MDEKKHAFQLAHVILDDASRDPDSDISVLARQLLRSRGMESWYRRKINTAHDMLRDTPAPKKDVELVLYGALNNIYKPQ